MHGWLNSRRCEYTRRSKRTVGETRSIANEDRRKVGPRRAYTNRFGGSARRSWGFEVRPSGVDLAIVNPILGKQRPKRHGVAERRPDAVTAEGHSRPQRVDNWSWWRVARYSDPLGAETAASRFRNTGHPRREPHGASVKPRRPGFLAYPAFKCENQKTTANDSRFKECPVMVLTHATVAAIGECRPLPFQQGNRNGEIAPRGHRLTTRPRPSPWMPIH